MNKSEFVAALAEASGESQATVGKVLDAFESTVVDTVADGGKIALTGFLSFEQGFRAARQGKNPQTGEAIQIKAAKTAKVKVGKRFKDAVNS